MNGRWRTLRWSVPTALVTLFLTFVVSSGSAQPTATLDRTGTYTAGTFTFGNTQKLVQTGPVPLTGFNLEPEIKTDVYGNVYVTSMEGVPGGVDLWKSTDKGSAFTYLGQPDGAQCPLPPNCTNGVGLGGGDDSLDVSSGGYVYLSSLWLGSTTMSVSPDGATGGLLPGQKWEVNPIAAQPPAIDRQWLAAYGPQILYQSYTDIATGTVFVEKSLDNGKTFTSVAPVYSVAPGAGRPVESYRLGNLVVDQYNGNVYTSFVADSTLGHTRAEIWFAKSTNGGATFSLTKAYQGPAGTQAGHSFTSMAVDRAGNIHIAFSRCLVDSTTQARSDCQVWLTSSADQGATWLDAVRVSNGFENASAVFPWIGTGSPGVVDITWYGSSALSPDINAPNNDWYLFFAQTANALSPTPTFSEQKAIPQKVHDSSICFRGLNCDISGGNRDLAEYYTMTVDPDGNANIAFSDTVNAGCSTTCTWFTRQTAGPTAYSPPAPPPATSFAANYMIDPTHTGGEPNLWVDSDNCIYATAIGSNAPGGLPVYKSTNDGSSFALKPLTGPIEVGDADVISVPDSNAATNDDVYVSSLELADVRIMKSADGESFNQAPPPANFSNFSSDRMWFAEDKIGLDQVLYQNDHELVTEDIRVFKSVNDGAWVGNSAITDPELATTIPNTNTGNIVVDHSNHNVYTVFPASIPPTNAMQPPFGKLLNVWMGVSTGNTTSMNAGTVWTDYPVFKGIVDSPITTPAAAKTFGVNAGTIFAVTDVDSAGNLYVAWGMNNARTNQFDIWFASSRDQGRSWYGPFKVNSDVGTHVMPWLVAGDNGRISIAWYGTTTVGDPNTLPASAEWNVHFAQSLNANAREPVFTQVQAGDHVMHVGSVRTGGLVGSGDRRLLDFFEIALNRAGMTHIVYADTGTTTAGAAKLSYTRQTAGPSAYTSPPALPTCPGGTTAVSLSRFTATQATSRSVRVEWKTASEIQTTGYNVWRSTGKAGYERVNPKLIPSQSAFGVGGHAYRYLDRSVLPGRSYSYKLELVGLDGRRQWAGPVRASVRAVR